MGKGSVLPAHQAGVLTWHAVTVYELVALGAHVQHSGKILLQVSLCSQSALCHWDPNEFRSSEFLNIVSCLLGTEMIDVSQGTEQLSD